MARHGKRHHDYPSLAEKTLIIDNGAYNIKAGFSTENPDVKECQLIPNCIAKSREKKVYVGAQLSKCRDFGDMVFVRPLEKGFVVNWPEEKAIWESAFLDSTAVLKCDPHETNLILTEAPNCPQTLQVFCDQMVFEEFEFASYYRCVGPSLNAYNDIPSLFGDNSEQPPKLSQLPAECLLLIDSGYSHTTVTPLLHGRPIQNAVRRLDVGGKFLTNALKETLSTQYYNVQDDTIPVTEIKESACYVSDDFKRDLDRTWKLGARQRREIDYSIVIDWVLPDYENTMHGYSLPHDPKLPFKTRTLPMGESVLPMANERFQIPELLFNPSDIGLAEGGLSDIVMQSLEQLPKGLWPAMLGNIVLVGGTSKLKGLRERLEAEIRQNTPSDFPVRVALHPEAEKATWLGGARMANNEDLMKRLCVTRQEYLEHGHTLMHTWTNRQFQARANAVGTTMLEG
ncbi:actin-like protein [Rhizodiscina lignyota]|uniref:Actin-like protein ARP6 n=1 Tax=Rhizodiscina lignyota TaxID=1504668 RepID=A0A9P4IEN4_9PEZI|nr:actin-like protein [Rhizodiscina lignyota]